MKKIILNTFFPKKCINCKKVGTYVCPNCFTDISYNQKNTCVVCDGLSDGRTHLKCLRQDMPDGFFVVCMSKGVATKLVNSFVNPPYVRALGPVIGKIMAEELAQNEALYGFLRLNPVIVPMPITKGELRIRGYNQSRIISDYVAQYFKLDIASNLLINEKYNKGTQNKFTKEYEIGKKEPIGKAVILIADSLSDRSTLIRVSKVLKKHGVTSVVCVAFV